MVLKKKKRAPYSTPKLTVYGECPHCREKIGPKCPHCGSFALLKLRGETRFGIYYTCKQCKQASKGVPI